MNSVDWAIIGVLGISCFIGLKRGLVRECLSLLSLGLALVLASRFKDALARDLAYYLPVPAFAPLIAFGAIVIVVLVAMFFVNATLTRVIRLVGLGGLDRALGLGFGLMRGAAVVLVCLLALPLAIDRVESARWWRDSRLIPEFLAVEDSARTLVGDVSAWLQQFMQNV